MNVVHRIPFRWRLGIVSHCGVVVVVVFVVVVVVDVAVMESCDVPLQLPLLGFLFHYT